RGRHGQYLRGDRGCFLAYHPAREATRFFGLPTAVLRCRHHRLPHDSAAGPVSAALAPLRRPTVNVLLEVEGVTMRFGGLVALDDVSFSVDRGAVLAVIGPNGAGKSTLFNVITGVYKPTSGRVRLGGAEITGTPTYDVVQQGIARTFQSSRLFSDLSVLDNIIIGMHTRTKAGVLDVRSRPGVARREMAACVERAEAILQSSPGDLYEQRYRPAGTLAQADRRRLEVARALASQPKLLLLDEPSAGMDEAETDALVADL